MKRIFGLVLILVLLFVGGCNNELTATLSFDEETVTIYIGEEKALNYSYENIKEPVFTFNLSKEGIVSIDGSGKIIGLIEGKVIVDIYEEKSKLSANLEINVLKRLTPAVSFQLEEVTLEFEEEKLLLFTFENIDSPVVTFISSDDNIVSVDSKGNIKGLNSGEAVITIFVVGSEETDSINVFVLEPLISGPIYNITTNEELAYALERIKDNDVINIIGNVETEELDLKNIKLTIEGSLTVNNIVKFSNVEILDSPGIFHFNGEIQINNNFTINGINLIDNNFLVQSNAKIVIKNNALLGSIILDEDSNNIEITNYGSIYNVDFNNSKAVNNKKIIVNNYGVLRDFAEGIIINEIVTPENTVIRSLGKYFWIKETSNFTNWDILENGPRYTFRHLEGNTLEIFLNNKSGSLEKVVNDYSNLYLVLNMEENIIIKTEYHSLSVEEFAFLKTINQIKSVNLYETTVAKNTIPENAFKDISTLERIDLPKGLTTIASEAFAGTGIQEIIIPDSLVNVASDAFGDYTVGDYVLSEVHTTRLVPLGEAFIKGFSPKTIFFVPEEAISDYVSKWASYSTIVEYGFYYYGSYLFPSAFLLDGYYIREVDKGIEIVLYNGNIKEDLIPSEFNINGEVISVVSIGNNAFRYVINDDNLSIDITIPSSITRIGNNAFFEFKTIKSLDLNNVVYVGKGAFNLISYEFTTISSPNLEYLDDDSFNGLTKVTHIDLEKVTYLGERSLQNWQSIILVDLHSLKFLGTGSLSNCINLETIIFGAIEECSSFSLTGSNKIKVIDFSHDENREIKPSFGSGWTHIDNSKVTIYCNSDVISHFQLYFPKANIITK